MADVYGGQALPDLPLLPEVLQLRVYDPDGRVVAVYTGHLANLAEGYRAIFNNGPHPQAATARLYDATSLPQPQPDEE